MHLNFRSLFHEEVDFDYIFEMSANEDHPIAMSIIFLKDADEDDDDEIVMRKGYQLAVKCNFFMFSFIHSNFL